MAKTQISLKFKHESSHRVWVEIARHGIEACQKAENQLKKGQVLELASIDIDINILSAKCCAKKKKKKK